jgi:hypothetical protein
MRPKLMKLLRDTSPQLRSEWDSANNGGLSFDNVRSGAKQKAHWICSKNPNHRWEAQIRDRSMGHGCPYCSGRYSLREESFGSLHPGLLKQWDGAKNAGIDPFAIGPLHKMRVWWKCDKCEHGWTTQLRARTIRDAGCPNCRIAANSLASAAPEIAQQWHPEKNGSKLLENVAIGSRYIAWWKCDREPSHVWQSQVRSRTMAKTGCPLCVTDRPTSAKPTLADYSSTLSAQWHPSKNGSLTPRDVTTGSSRKVWWQCDNDRTHEWATTVSNRVRFGHGCPKCAKRSASPSITNNLATKFPALARQWHPEKNGALTPEDVTPGSQKRVWWRCDAEPPHVWDATIYNRTSRQPDAHCPSCAGNKLVDANSLATVHPEVAKEWHPSKNGELKPEDVTRASGKKVWWICARNPSHEWEGTVKNRTVHKSGCPHCESETRSSRFEMSLIEMAQSYIDYSGTFHRSLTALRTLTKQAVPRTVQLRHTFFRMLYSSAITALETYLSDAFVQNVVSDQSRMETLLSTAPEFLDRKYALSDVVDWSKNLNRRVTEYLVGIIWHNPSKVRPMYSTVLGVTFPSDSKSIYQAIAVRHDLVHRNGRSKENHFHRITSVEVDRLLNDVESFVQHIDSQVKNLPKPSQG